MRILIATILALTLAGCQTTNTATGYQGDAQPQGCRYLERDLTATWDERTYWCVPGRVKND